MKKITHIGMAALVAMGMLGTSCNKAESPELETPETQKENIVTLTTTVSFAADGTKALTGAGVKTFAEGETMAIYYWKNKGNDHVKAVSAPLTAGDITNGGKSATFTFTLDNPYKDMSVVYTYPAAMANADFTPNYDALYNNQDGTLATLASDFDFCTKSGAWAGENLPSLTLENQLAILAITLKNADGSSDITSSITGLTLSDGTKTYAVSRSAVAGPIYVAIRPTSDATITVTATDGTKNYTKTLTSKTYEAGNGYPVSWRMAEIISLSSRTKYDDELVIPDGYIVTGSAVGLSCKVAVADGATVTLRDVENNGVLDGNPTCPGIRCLGDATIILEGDNTLTGGDTYAGIYVPEDKTLTIRGTGSLTVTGGISGAGIGGNSEGNCGSIVISGGTITAKGGSGGAGIGLGYSSGCAFGDITISGGTVTATGSGNAPGIGGPYANFQNITITDGVTKVTVSKGSSSPYSIGTSEIDEYGYYGAITIGGTVYFNGGSFENDGDSYLQTSPLVYQP